MKTFLAALLAVSTIAIAAIAPANATISSQNLASFDGPAFGPADIKGFDGPAFGPSDIRSFDGPARDMTESSNQR